MSIGRGNRKTRKIHAKSSAGRLTACGLPQKRRYVRNGNESAGWAVNCTPCLKALVASSTFEEFLTRCGTAKTGPRGFPVRKCRRCGEWDEFTSESDAHGICCSCMHICNRPSH